MLVSIITPNGDGVMFRNDLVPVRNSLTLQIDAIPREGLIVNVRYLLIKSLNECFS